MSFLRRKPTTDESVESLLPQLEAYKERSEFLLLTVRTLLFLIKEFTFDISEIDADKFNKRIDELTKLFTSDTPTGKVARAFDEQKREIQQFCDREKRYFDEREAELKNIIDMLRDSLSSMIGESQAFNAQIHERNLKMERVSQLNDIRKIKETLQVEVSLLRKAIQDKQMKDTKRMETLTREVDTLKVDLEKIKGASLLDCMTGAHNRLAFDTYLCRYIERNLVAYSPFSILMCDLDNFKAVNDTYGHQVGDRVLMSFVQECKAAFRRDDFIARYGGEEFVIVLPGMRLPAALKRARLFCKSLASKRFLIDPKKDDSKMSFTVSIGVSEVRKNDMAESLIERADAALYQAKNAGKNRAVGENEVKKGSRAVPAGV
jgi:diguanylate cyclase